MILKIQNLSKGIGKQKIIKNVNFTMGEGTIVALVGPNGAGKTTFLKLITDLLKPDNGVIEIDGYSLDKQREKALKQLSFMQDNTTLYSYLTGYDHLKLLAKIKKVSMEEVKRVVEKIGIESYVYTKVHKYSLGMKQHLLLALAILGEPKLLILDEPLNGLDPTSIIMLRDLLLELEKKGTSILFSSHNLSEVDKIAKSIAFIKHGELVAQKEIDSFTNKGKLSAFLIVNDIEKATNILNEENIRAELIAVKGKGSQIQILLEHLNDSIKILHLNNITILDVEKSENEAEFLYYKLYGDEV